MKITKQWLEGKNACGDGVEWFAENYPRGGAPIPVLRKLMKADKFPWANWLIVRVMERQQYLRYAIFAAEQVLDIFEKKYPDNKKPREAIEAARRVLGKDNKENRKAAACAASDAYDASSANAYDAYAAAAAYAASNATAAYAAVAAYAASDASTAYTSAAAAVVVAVVAAYAATSAASDAAAAAYAAYASDTAAYASVAAAYDAAAAAEMQARILDYGISLLEGK